MIGFILILVIIILIALIISLYIPGLRDFKIPFQELFKATDDGFLTAKPYNLQYKAYANGSTMYKIYPLCCEKCRNYANKILSLYQKSTDLAVLPLKSSFKTSKHPNDNLDPNPGYEYLVLVFDKPTLYYESNVPTLSELEQLANTVKTWKSDGYHLSDLGIGNVTNHGLIVHLDCLHPLDKSIPNVYDIKGSVLTHSDPSLFQNPQEYIEFVKKLKS